MSIAALETFVLDLNSSVSLGEWIRLGSYDHVDENYGKESFRSQVGLMLTGRVQVVLYDPNGFVLTEDIVARMKEDGFVPAALDHALAMGAQYPERQTQNPIVFLGTERADGSPEPYGVKVVPALDDLKDGRRLCLYWSEGGWAGESRFAAVREVQHSCP